MDIVLSGEKYNYKGLSLGENNQPARRYNVLLAILIVASIAALVLAATSLSKSIQSKETKTSRLRIGNPPTTEDAPTTATSYYEGPGWSKSGNRYYKYFTDARVDYNTAKAKCFKQGGRLAAKVLRDPAVVRDIVSSGFVSGDWTTGKAPWIGFDDLSHEGVWKWVDGGDTNPATTEWASGEPNNSNGNENCGHILRVTRGKLVMNDHVCSTRLYYICEIDIDPYR